MGERTSLVLTSVLIGLVSSLCAVALKSGVHGTTAFANQVLFTGHHSYFVLFIPCIGELLSVWITRRFLKGDLGRGLPNLLKDVQLHGGNVAPHKIWSQVVTSILTMGTGGSAGLEAPLAITGAAMGQQCSAVVRVRAGGAHPAAGQRRGGRGGGHLQRAHRRHRVRVGDPAGEQRHDAAGAGADRLRIGHFAFLAHQLRTAFRADHRFVERSGPALLRGARLPRSGLLGLCDPCVPRHRPLLRPFHGAVSQSHYRIPCAGRPDLRVPTLVRRRLRQRAPSAGE
ncbi:MAG: chloride channel protein [Flavobacteriales bacterium]|nr:chloride channel protein [Flavobacteriales bacterium]